MIIVFNHTIARDKEAAARFFAQLSGSTTTRRRAPASDLLGLMEARKRERRSVESDKS